MRKSDVDSNHGDENRLKAISVSTFVFVNRLAIFENLGNILDLRDKLTKTVSELGWVGDLEEIQRFCLLWEATPVVIDEYRIDGTR